MKASRTAGSEEDSGARSIVLVSSIAGITEGTRSFRLLVREARRDWTHRALRPWAPSNTEFVSMPSARGRLTRNF